MLVLLEHHVKSKANQLKITTIYNLSIIKYYMSNKNTKEYAKFWVLTLNWLVIK